MKSLIVFVDFDRNTDILMDRVRRYLSMGDVVFFTHELQTIDDSLVPLIGDLTEIRKRKIKVQLVDLFNGLGALTPNFYPIVFEDHLDLSEYLDNINKCREVLILDSNKYLFQLDQKRFSRWIEGVNQPVKAINHSEEIVTLKS
jgi:hypothetical protein